MNSISYLKHCSPIYNLPNILKDGYIRSSTELKQPVNYNPCPSKIYTQIVFGEYEDKSFDYAGGCILLDKKLLNRSDYVINTYVRGPINNKTLQRPKKITASVLKKIGKRTNEVIFDRKISLKKYIVGVKLWSWDNERLNYIEKCKTFEEYAKLMPRKMKKNELMKQYKEGRLLFKQIYKYTRNIKYKDIKWDD